MSAKRILRIAAVKSKTGYSAPTIYRKIKEGKLVSAARCSNERITAS
jgi:predicted DNA-binding transcriptional regulator AlpA